MKLKLLPPITSNTPTFAIILHLLSSHLVSIVCFCPLSDEKGRELAYSWTSFTDQTRSPHLTKKSGKYGGLMINVYNLYFIAVRYHTARRVLLAKDAAGSGRRCQAYRTLTCNAWTLAFEHLLHLSQFPLQFHDTLLIFLDFILYHGR